MSEFTSPSPSSSRVEDVSQNRVLRYGIMLMGLIWMAIQVYRYLRKRASRPKYVGARNAAGQYHGKGTLTTSNGDVYEGHFMDGRFHGQGKYTFSTTKTVYEGAFAAGAFHGRGRESYGDGSVYVGEFAHGDRSGHGIMTYANGVRYEGSWVKGKKCGQGLFRDAEGTQFMGTFVAGKLHGKGRIKASGEKKWSDAEWANGVRIPLKSSPSSQSSPAASSPASSSAWREKLELDDEVPAHAKKPADAAEQDENNNEQSSQQQQSYVRLRARAQ